MNKKAIVDKGSIQSISKYIEIIERIQEESKNKIIAYRGHYLAEEYRLKPGIGRISNYNLDIERSIFYDFKKYSYSYLDKTYIPKTEIDWLFLAQHYGIPTRLLDWTLNPLVALFFACYKGNETKEEDGQVIISTLPKSSQKECKDDIDPFENAHMLSKQFIIPDYFDSRLANQRGVFTFSANPKEELEINGFTINIEEGKKESILRELDSIGMGVDFIYPTLDRLSERLKKQYNL